MLRLAAFVCFFSFVVSSPSPVSLFKALPETPQATTDGRIAGGSAVNITSYPWQLSLQYEGNHICGASIISANWSLTAAHCIEGFALSVLQLRAGSSYHASGGTVHSISKGYIHGYYNYTTLDYDIGVLQVSSPFAIGSSGISVARLPNAGYYPTSGTVLYVSGWGYISDENETLPSQLRAVDLPVVSKERCREVYGSTAITERMLCAGHGSPGKDSCGYDSGGPLVENSTVVGIVSWGSRCGLTEYPGVYTDVASLRNWITQATGV